MRDLSITTLTCELSSFNLQLVVRSRVETLKKEFYINAETEKGNLVEMIAEGREIERRERGGEEKKKKR